MKRLPKYRVKTWDVINLLLESVKKSDLLFVSKVIRVIDEAKINNTTTHFMILQIQKTYPDLARYLELFNNNILEFTTSVEDFKKLNIE